MGGMPPSITAKYIRETLASSAITPFCQFCLTNLHQGNAGKLGNYPILSVLPDKVARFLFEYHSHRFESLDLPHLPADRSNFDVHGALLDDKVQTNCNTLRFAQS
jgi:hypothetical protein